MHESTQLCTVITALLSFLAGITVIARFHCRRHIHTSQKCKWKLVVAELKGNESHLR